MKPRRTPLASAVVVVAALVAVPLLIEIRTDIMNLLVQLFIFSTLAVSWNFVAGFTGQINLGFAAFFGNGVTISHVLWSNGVPVYIGIIAGGLGSMVLSVFIGLPTLRLKGMYFAIGTFALAEALRIVVANVLPRARHMPGQVLKSFSYESRYYLGLVILIAAFCVTYALVRSRFGLAIRATRDDEGAAQVSGVNTFRYKVMAVLTSSFFVGLAGGLQAFYRVNFDSLSVQAFGTVWNFIPVIAVAIGGMSTFVGPIVGSVFYVALSEILGLYAGQAHFIVLGGLFIIVMLYFPHGLVEAGRQLHALTLRAVRGRRCYGNAKAAGGKNGSPGPG